MSKVQYSRIGSEENASFDYSSAFTYESTQSYSSSQKFESAFSYSRKNVDQPNVQLERGLKHKTFGVRLLHWGAIALYLALILLTLPVTIWFVIKKVKRDEQVILSRLGIVKCIKGPSMLCVIPCIDKLQRYSTSLRAFNVPPQRLMTSTGLLVELGAVVKYQISDAEKAFFAAQNLDHVLRMTAQGVAARVVSRVDEKELTDTGRIAEINELIKTELQKAYLSWGVIVVSFELCGLKALIRIEQQDAISNVIEPLKQWFFGSSGAPTTGMTPVAGPHASPPQPPPAPVSGSAMVNNLESLRHNLTPTDLLTAVKSVCNRQLVERTNAIYKFVVPGDAPGVYYLDLKNGMGDCGPGEPPTEPDTTLTVSLPNMQRMFTGCLQPFDAYMSGELKISGDVGGAMKLDQLVKTISSASMATQGSTSVQIV